MNCIRLARHLHAPQLRSLLLEHGIHFPSSAKKANLVNLFSTQLKPRGPQILAADARVRPSAKGIMAVSSASGQESLVQPETPEKPVAPVPRTPATHKRTLTARPKKSEPEETEPPAKKARARSSRKTAKSETDSDAMDIDRSEPVPPSTKKRVRTKKSTAVEVVIPTSSTAAASPDEVSEQYVPPATVPETPRTGRKPRTSFVPPPPPADLKEEHEVSPAKPVKPRKSRVSDIAGNEVSGEDNSGFSDFNPFQSGSAAAADKERRRRKSSFGAGTGETKRRVPRPSEWTATSAPTTSILRRVGPSQENLRSPPDDIREQMRQRQHIEIVEDHNRMVQKKLTQLTTADLVDTDLVQDEEPQVVVTRESQAVAAREPQVVDTRDVQVAGKANPGRIVRMPNHRATHSQLVWSKTDATKSNWPAYTMANTGGYYTQLDASDKKYKLYREKIGKHVATFLGLSSAHADNAAMDLPDGYALFCHSKEMTSGKMREDVYMFGSTIVHKFRSPNEFLPHAEWLLDPDTDIEDHSTCRCQYNRASELSNDKKRRQSGVEENVPKRPKVADEPPPDLDTIVPERSLDHRLKRRFRKGELVFFRIKSIPPPAGTKKDLPDITHWPGLIAGVTAKRASPEGKLATLNSMMPTKGPVTFEYQIRPLGMFDKSCEVFRPTASLLPYSVAPQVLGGPAGQNEIGKEAYRVLRETIEREAKEDPPKSPADLIGGSLAERWSRRLGEKIPFEDMVQSWDAVVIRLTVGLQIAISIASSWTQTDKLSVLAANDLLSKSDLQELEDGSKNLYQGVWFHGERIWVDDLVRLRKSRQDLPDQLLRPAGPGAESRGVFLFTRAISLQETSRANKTTGSQHSDWRCYLNGDLFELVEESYVPDDASDEELPKLPPHVKPPPGFKYRRLNPRDVEVTVDIFDVVGRCYPDLLTTDTAWFYPPNLPEDKRHGRVEASPYIMSLTGLGNKLPPVARYIWRNDLYTIVKKSTEQYEVQFRDHYASLLRHAVGFPSLQLQTPHTSAPVTPVRNGFAGGSALDRSSGREN